MEPSRDRQDCYKLADSLGFPVQPPRFLWLPGRLGSLLTTLALNSCSYITECSFFSMHKVPVLYFVDSEIELTFFSWFTSPPIHHINTHTGTPVRCLSDFIKGLEWQKEFALGLENCNWILDIPVCKKFLSHCLLCCLACFSFILESCSQNSDPIKVKIFLLLLHFSWWAYASEPHFLPQSSTSGYIVQKT